MAQNPFSLYPIAVMMPFRKATRLTKRVLVIGDHDLGALAIIRSLGRAGIEVHLVGWFATGITRASRYVTRFFDFGNPEADADRFVVSVLEAVATTKYDLVLPVVDAAMSLL